MYCYVALSDLTSVVTEMVVCVSSFLQEFGTIHLEKASSCQDFFCACDFAENHIEML